MSEQRRIELPRSPRAASIARSTLSEWFGSELDDEQLQSAQLIVSELATNAFLHGRGRIELRAALNDDGLLGEVVDEGAGFERELRHRDFDDVGGRGLSIVDAEASRWGIHEGTTHVWFELERPGPRLGRAEKPAP